MLNQCMDKLKSPPSTNEETDTQEATQEETFFKKAKSTFSEGFKQFQGLFKKKNETLSREPQQETFECSMLPLASTDDSLERLSEKRFNYSVNDYIPPFSRTQRGPQIDASNQHSAQIQLNRPQRRVYSLPSEPLYKGSLPENFWREIAIYPHTVSSYEYENNPALRKDIKEYAIRYQRSRRK